MEPFPPKPEGFLKKMAILCDGLIIILYSTRANLLSPPLPSFVGKPD
jgi:hypothetical protein